MIARQEPHRTSLRYGLIAGILTLGILGSSLSAQAQELFVANANGGTVESFDSTGTSLGIFASGLGSPRPIAFDTDGDLYVGDYLAGRIPRARARRMLRTSSRTALPSSSCISCSPMP